MRNPRGDHSLEDKSEISQAAVISSGPQLLRSWSALASPSGLIFDLTAHAGSCSSALNIAPSAWNTLPQAAPALFPFLILFPDPISSQWSALIIFFKGKRCSVPLSVFNFLKVFIDTYMFVDFPSSPHQIAGSTGAGRHLLLCCYFLKA